MKCSFCKTEIPPGTGKIYSSKAEKRMHFCSGKCEKSHNMGRNPRKLKWITKNPKTK
ncbi:MAG: 50S ribosomal protein L24e [DPANN group archaeon]|nr:50S ribosomal protein L24e [DPANN group archaeon]